MKRVIRSVPIVLIAAGCTGLGEQSQGVGSRALEPWGPAGGQSLLYARDGSPVPSEPAGAVTTGEGAARDLGANDGSRPYLLELYQSAVQRKEDLELEVAALQRAIDDAEAARAREAAERAALEQRIASLESAAAELERSNVELAGRLATAQIRRLEAEKLLLETTLEWSRFRVALESDRSTASDDAVHEGDGLDQEQEP